MTLGEEPKGGDLAVGAASNKVNQDHLHGWVDHWRHFT